MQHVIDTQQQYTHTFTHTLSLLINGHGLTCSLTTDQLPLPRRVSVRTTTSTKARFASELWAMGCGPGTVYTLGTTNEQPQTPVI